jgi:hypothetical protein
MAIVDLEYHPFAYVTIRELAEYWRLPKRRVLHHIRAGNFEAIQLGPGIYRVRTTAALAFEQRALGSNWKPVSLADWRRTSLPPIASTPADADATAAVPARRAAATPDNADVSRP